MFKVNLMNSEKKLSALIDQYLHTTNRRQKHARPGKSGFLTKRRIFHGTKTIELYASDKDDLLFRIRYYNIIAVHIPYHDWEECLWEI